MEQVKFYYHHNVPYNTDYCKEVFEDFSKFYVSKTHLLTNPTKFAVETSFGECETDNDLERGRLVAPPATRFLVHCDRASLEPIETLLPVNNDGILIIAWLTLFNLTFNDLEELFSYRGNIIIDDMFEVHTHRIHVFREWLESKNLLSDNISFWTNGPNYDNNLDYSKNIFRHNWLHLTEYGFHLSKTRKHRIAEISDKEALKAHNNKKYKALYMNGHSTAQREYLLGCFAELDATDQFLYSFRDPVDSYSRYFNFATNKDRNLYIPKCLPNDMEDDRVGRDRFKQDIWWQESFYNINVETNLNWRDNNIRLITEKWMKGIMYLTPSFNLGDYHGLEEYQVLLGFNNYSTMLDKSYDNIVNWNTRTETFAKCVANTPIPSEAEWQQMMVIAEDNYNHLHQSYIPSMINLFFEIVQELLDK